MLLKCNFQNCSLPFFNTKLIESFKIIIKSFNPKQAGGGGGRCKGIFVKINIFLMPRKSP